MGVGAKEALGGLWGVRDGWGGLISALVVWAKNSDLNSDRVGSYLDWRAESRRAAACATYNAL